MSNISERDYQQTLAFLQGLYSKVSFEDLSSYIIENITKLVSSNASVFGTVDLGSCEAISRGDAPEIPGLEELFREHLYEHPMVEHYLNTFDLSACKISDFWTQEQLHRSEVVYHRYMKYFNAEDVLSLPFYAIPTSG